MKLALMQPYLFPYLGYLQLVAAVDRFVFYDDVNYIKNGWINRNRINLHGQPHYFTVPLREASPFQPIREVRTAPPEAWRRKLLESLRHQYRRAPCFEPVFALAESVFALDTDRIAVLAAESVTQCAAYLGLPTRFVASSTGYGNAELKGPARVIDICRREGASEYWNLPGGRALYDDAAFAAHRVQLRFVEPDLFEYRQGVHPFVPGLSILDVLMHNPPDVVREHLATREGVAA